MEHIPVKELTLFLEGFFALIAYSGESWFVSRFLAFFFFFSIIIACLRTIDFLFTGKHFVC